MTTNSIFIINNSNLSEIKSRMNERFPIIIRNYDIGSCKELWTQDYVAEKVGNTPVKIHVSMVGNMNFITKNFAYKTLPFDELIKRTSTVKQTNYFFQSEEYYYLRSLGADPRGREVANFSRQYPGLSADLKIPPFFEENDFFSSVLRVSSAHLRLWTHYDIMDNILIQVRGIKEVTLWSPNEVENLYLVGDKSAVLDIDNPDEKEFPKFLDALQYKGVLLPGDILFIPAMWFHNTLAIDPGIAVNVFWKNLSHELYDKKDPYGNKDLIPGAKGLQFTENSIKSIETLPKDYRNFYLRRMIEVLKKNIEI